MEIKIRKQHHCQRIGFCQRIEENKHCRGSSHLSSVRNSPFKRKGISSSLPFSTVSARKCFYNRSIFSFIPQFHPPRPLRLSLPLQVCVVTLWCSPSLSSGKIILPSSSPAGLISDRGEMNKGSKESFLSPFFSHCQVIFTPGPSGPAQCRTHQLHMTGVLISGTWGGAVVSPLKPFYRTCTRTNRWR